MEKEAAKAQIASLVDKYKEVSSDKESYRRYNEEMTKLRFINPLFSALGWDIENKNRKDEVTFEDKISKGRVDYGFRINGISKFYLEAKALKANIDDPNFARQAIDYSWNKGCTWAVLTDFETIKIFNAEWRESDYSQSHLKTIHVHEFLNRFEELWLLSKDSFQEGRLDREAEKWGKKTKKTTVDKQLLEDFTTFRELLSRNVAKLNSDKQLTIDQLNESVQRILDRLIFIRYCEDRELEDKKLLSYLREWESRGKGQLIRSLRDVFQYFDKHYNSKIFAKHLCDDLEIENKVLHEIIEGLHFTKDRAIVYDFSAIEADVLGNIYEQYLGHILKKTEKRATLTASQTHRKEQGIFYTPTFIVDYIVRHTLGSLLETKKRNDIQKLRILDPACGSGSFLIKSFDFLNAFYMKNEKDYGQTRLDLNEEDATYSKKLEILQNHIFGVDLDRQAVEVAQLNLLLKVAEKGRRLPLLQQNIKQGNSIMSKSLSREDHAFDWHSEFKQILDEEGGFDVAIGNPPYVRQEELLRIKPYLESNYTVYHSMADLFVYFFERELRLVKAGGYLGMIVSNKWLKAGYALKLRKFLSKYWIDQFIDFGDLKVFPNATTYPCVIIIRRTEKINPKIRVCVVKSLKFDSLDTYISENAFTVDQSNLEENGWNFQSATTSKLFEKIKSFSMSLKEYTHSEVYRGILTGLTEVFVIDRQTRDRLIQEDKKSTEIIKPFLTGKEVRRYGINFQDRFIILTKIGVDIKRYPAILRYLSKYKEQLERRWDKGNYWYELRACDFYELFDKPKMVYGKITTQPRFTIDNDGYLLNDSNFFIPNIDLKLLGILNSKLGWFLIMNTCTQVQNGYQLIWKYFGNVPIISQDSQDLEKLVDRMLTLTKQISDLGSKRTDERDKLDREAVKLSLEIDEEVYKLYRISEQEKRIIEEAVAN